MSTYIARPYILLPFLAFVLTLAVSDAQPRPRIAVVAPEAYDGALMIDESLESQAQRAGLIVIGRVESVTSRKTSRSIESDVAISVDKSLKGNAPKKLTLTLPGGTVDGIRLQVGDVPNFLSGERVLLLLDGSAKPKLLRRWQSKYSLAGTDAYQPETHSKVTISSLETRLGSALKKSVSIPVSDVETVSIAFTTYCAPWAAADMPVLFEVNPASPGTGGPAGSGFSRLVYASWHNWQALTDSYVNFSYAGTTTRSGYNTADGLNTISWGTLDPGVLGENHCSYYLNGPRIDSDTIISNQFSWDSDSSNGVSGYSLESVLEHELGHGLGMGHTTPGANDPGCDGTASTPVMCPAIAPGQRKTIKPDDRAGAASMYPLSGSPPAAPTNVTATQNGNAYNVSWTASTGSKNAYDVERGNSACSGAWVPAGTVAAASTSFTDDDFTAGLSGTYCYRVKALGVGGDSGWSNTSLGLPPYGVTWGSHTTPATMPASTPSQVSVSFTNTGSLTWASSGPNPVRLSYHWRSGACPGSSNVVWDGPRAALAADVSTGDSVNGLNITVTPPSSP
ncbi:MAG TPA: matrixin family metalloprotease, partial [Dehalococcoidia bacterium]